MCDKPMECNKCKRKGEIYYTEMKDGQSTKYVMCKSCPLLKSKLYIQQNESKESTSVFEKDKAKCPVCGLTSDEFTVTLTLGCESCAKTFKDILSAEIVSGDMLPKNVKDKEELETYHFGNTPKNTANSAFSKRLETLQLALNEAIESEQFEDAADIRDQIQKYLENPNAGTK